MESVSRPETKMRNILTLGSLLLLGCSTATKMILIEYEWHDIPGEQRIELSYLNASRQTLCLLPEDWPSSIGAIGAASNSVYLIVELNRFAVARTLGNNKRMHCARCLCFALSR